MSCRGLLDDLDGGQFARLLVVLDLRTDFQVQLSTQSIVEMREELSLEDAVAQWIGFLATDDERKPIIAEVGSADSLDGSDRNGSL